MAGLKDAAYRSKFVRWMWLPLVALTLGILISLKGPTFPDLQLITGTDKEMASFFFISSACGYLVGSFLAGPLHSKVDNNKVMAVTLSLAGCTTIWTPYCTNFSVMLLSQFLASLFCGAIDTTINAEHMRIWGRRGPSLLQFTHFVSAAGGILSPLFAAPFLSEKTVTEYNNKTTELVLDLINSSRTEKTEVTYTLSGTHQPRLHLNSTNNTSSNAIPAKTSHVHTAFLIGGIIAIVASIPFLVMIFVDKRAKRRPEEKYGQEPSKRKLPICLHLSIASLLGTFYLLYYASEAGFSFFLMTFVTEEFEEVSTADGAYITTFFWASFAAARFALIFISKWVAAVRLLYCHLFLMLLAYTGFLVSAYYGRIDVLKCFTCLIGIATSAVVPAGFSWTESELLMVTGRISSVILVGSSLGGVIVFFLVGYLMQNMSNMWYCYILLGSTISLVLIFLFLLLFNRFYINRKYGTVQRGKTMEIEVTSPLASVE